MTRTIGIGIAGGVAAGEAGTTRVVAAGAGAVIGRIVASGEHTIGTAIAERIGVARMIDVVAAAAGAGAETGEAAAAAVVVAATRAT
jgi:hypothetical protein